MVVALHVELRLGIGGQGKFEDGAAPAQVITFIFKSNCLDILEIVLMLAGLEH
jgi:hypothetical protein